LIAPFKLTPFIPYEQDIQKAILVMLAYHTKVVWSARFNSGGAPMPCGGGKVRPIKFNTLDGCPDIMGMLKGGRHFSIEVKRPPWSKPKDKHEVAQDRHIAIVNAGGGLAFFCTSVEEAKRHIDSA
jgi:hypothetical protein